MLGHTIFNLIIFADMIREIQLRIKLKEAKVAAILKIKAAQKLGIPAKEIHVVKVLRKSIDARKTNIVFNYKGSTMK